MPADRDDTSQVAVKSWIWRQLPLSVLFCVLGTFVLGLFPYYGFVAYLGTIPLTFGCAVLMDRRKTWVAYIATIAGGAAGILFGYPSILVAVLLGVIATTYVVLLPRAHVQARFFCGSLISAVICLAGDLYTSMLLGLSFQGQINEVTSNFVTQLTVSGTVPAEVLTVLRRLTPTITSLWPALYVLYGMTFMVMVAFFGRLFLRRCHEEYKPPRLISLDLTVNMVWLLIAGLLFLLASYLPNVNARVMLAVGYNLIVCAVLVFAIQGFAVISFWMDRRGMHWAVQAIIYILAFQLELMFMVPSVIGLIDYWANFRKLPRESVGKAPTAAAGEDGGASGDDADGGDKDDHDAGGGADGDMGEDEDRDANSGDQG